MKLTQKQIRFCEEYMVNLNATQAAIKAGYGKYTAASTASHLLQKPNILAYIQQLQQGISQRLQVSSDKVVQELACLAFANLLEFVTPEMKLKDFSSMPPEKFAAIESFTITETEWPGGHKTTASVKLHDKIRALEQLGRHLGTFDRGCHWHDDKIHVIWPAMTFKNNNTNKMISRAKTEATQCIKVSPSARFTTVRKKCRFIENQMFGALKLLILVRK